MLFVGTEVKTMTVGGRMRKFLFQLLESILRKQVNFFEENRKSMALRFCISVILVLGYLPQISQPQSSSAFQLKYQTSAYSNTLLNLCLANIKTIKHIQEDKMIKWQKSKLAKKGEIESSLHLAHFKSRNLATLREILDLIHFLNTRQLKCNNQAFKYVHIRIRDWETGIRKVTSSDLVISLD